MTTQWQFHLNPKTRASGNDLPDPLGFSKIVSDVVETGRRQQDMKAVLEKKSKNIRYVSSRINPNGLVDALLEWRRTKYFLDHLYIFGYHATSQSLVEY